MALRDTSRPATLLGQEPVVGLDLGSQSIKALMVVPSSTGTLNFVAGGSFPSYGVRGGVVVDPESVAADIAEACEELEQVSGMRVRSVYASLGGTQVQSHLTRGETTVSQNGHEITLRDVERVIELARMQAPHGERITQAHVLPRMYEVDGVGGVPNPVGMMGFTLAVEACVITAPLTQVENLSRTLERSQIVLRGPAAIPLAAAEGVREFTGQNLAVAVVDLGAQTTNMAIYARGALAHATCVPTGGDHITEVIASELGTSLEVAETLKVRYGSCQPRAIREDDLIEPDHDAGIDEFVPRQVVAECISRGAQEVGFGLLGQIQSATRLGMRPATLLLTGGGAELEGIAVLVASVTQIPTQIMRPSGIVGLPAPLSRPGFAVATGLALWGARRRARGRSSGNGARAGFFGDLFRRSRGFFERPSELNDDGKG